MLVWKREKMEKMSLSSAASMKVKLPEIIFFVIYLLLVLFQIKTTNIRTAYSLTPHEVDLQIRRMNMFPPSLARLGYIMETKKEVQVLERLQSNFFTTIDFREYFPSRLPFILSLFLFIGLYYFVKERGKRKKFFYAFVLSIVILTILGPHAKYGPVLIMPFFVFSIFLGISKIVHSLKP